MHRWRSHAPRWRGLDDGFTLVELLIVLVILGVLVVIAVPSYLGLQAQAADTTAKSNIRAARVAAEAYALDNVGANGDADGKANTTGYKGMTVKILRTKYDAGISPTIAVVTGKTTQTTYCLSETVNGRTWSTLGPGGSDAFVKNAKCK